MKKIFATIMTLALMGLSTTTATAQSRIHEIPVKATAPHGNDSIIHVDELDDADYKFIIEEKRTAGKGTCVKTSLVKNGQTIEEKQYVGGKLEVVKGGQDFEIRDDNFIYRGLYWNSDRVGFVLFNFVRNRYGRTEVE